MSGTSRSLLVLCLILLGGCQSHTQARPGVVVNPDVGLIDNQLTSSTAASNTTETGANATNDANNTAPMPISLPNESFVVNRAQTTGSLQHPELTEVSGMAASTRQSNTFWAINDSGNSAKLFAFNHKGESLGSFNVNATNRDWEDMASAWINGESYLFIADIGDNLRVKEEHVVHIFSEPLLDNAEPGRLDPIRTIRFRYPDSAHNAEALAVDGSWLYVLTKEPLADGERQASRVYRIPFTLAGQAVLRNAELIAALAVPAGSIESSLIASIGGVDVSQPTALDIDPQSQTAYVLTYRNVYRYQREQNQSWGQAFAQPRLSVHGHSLSQAEALTIGDNGTVWFTSEKRPAPLWALPGNGTN